MELEADSLERLVPESMDPADHGGAETLALHQARYRFAAEQARPGRLLDLACGVGYGTRLVADQQPAVEEALGVDVAPAAIAYARDHYAGERVRYVEAEGMHFHDPAGFDTIISLETVEHVPEPEAFFATLVALLRPGGVLIASVPTTPSVDLNPHHRTDFTSRDFRRMGERHGLVECAELAQIQRHDPLEIFRGDRFKRENLRPHLLAYYAANPAAALKRVGATVRWGFASHYLTLAWRRTPTGEGPE